MADERREDSLIRGLAAGDERAFGRLFDAFAARMHRAAAALLGSREDTEDCVQEVFLGLLRSRGRLNAVEDMEAYLFASLRNAARRRLLERRRDASATDCVRADAIARPPTAPGGEAADATEFLERAIDALPEEQREVLVLKIDGGLSCASIGKILGVSANTAASRYRYALEKLRERLKGKMP